MTAAIVIHNVTWLENRSVKIRRKLNVKKKKIHEAGNNKKINLTTENKTMVLC